MSSAHQISDSEDSDATIDPNEDAHSDSTIDPNEELPSVGISNAKPGTSGNIDKKKSEDTAKPSTSKPYQFKKTYSSVHSISDSDSDSENVIGPSPNATQVTKSENGKKHSSSSQTKKSDSAKLGVSPNKSTPEKSPSMKRKASDGTPEEDKRPACPYGNACYRRSLSHIKNFRHVELFKDPEPSPKRAKKSDESCGSPAEVVAAAQPLSFLLTRVTGISDKYNGFGTLHITDILSPSMGKLEKSAQFNYCIDLHWLMEQYPAEFKTKPVTVVHGAQREEKKALMKEASVYPQMSLCQAKLEILYGTHHTKMMLLKYDKGMRVVIHTANLVEKDWYQKTQGIWVSPVFPELKSPSLREGDSPTNFKLDLYDYLSAYNAPLLAEWTDIIKQHDMSAAKVFIVGSVPGRHTGDKRTYWGHMKMRKLLGCHGPEHSKVHDWPVIGQFSSIGSLGSSPEAWLCSNLLGSLGSCRNDAGGKKATSSKLKLVFPSMENVRLSLEGYPAGQSIPYSHKTALKQRYLHMYWHQWKSDLLGRSKAMPHIKTYFRVSPDHKKVAWFLCTSANMSKAAWGMPEKSGTQLMIRSYELGVLFLPKFYDQGDAFATPCDKEPGSKHVFPMPYDLPLSRYADSDRPWLWDIPYVKLPDSHGNMWCPPL